MPYLRLFKRTLPDRQLTFQVASKLGTILPSHATVHVRSRFIESAEPDFDR